MNTNRLLLSSLVAGAGAALSPSMMTQPERAQAVSETSAYDKIDAYIEKEMHRLNIPGASLAIVQGDEIVHTRGFGRARPKGAPPSPQTPFVIGSLTKSFTALAVMQLVEAGKIDLDCPVQYYIPWFRVADPEASARITVRHLLNQSSGLPEGPDQQNMANFDNRPGAAERQLRTLSTLKLKRPVGSEFEYSNLNFNLAGLVVEAASGESYADYIQRHIFEPLEMRHSYTGQAEAKKDRLAVGHQLPFFFPVPVPDLPIPLGSLAGGELISCAEDMAHYLIAQLNGGRYNGGQVATPASIEEMHRGAIDWNVMGASIGKYAMGWAESGTEQTKIIWHTGNTPDFTGYMALIPDQKKGMVLLMNAGHHFMVPCAGEFGSDLANMLAGEKPGPGLFGFSFRRAAPWAMRSLLLIPALQIAGVITTLARLRNRGGSRRRGFAREVLLPLIPNVGLAALPVYLQRKKSLSYMRLFLPDFALIATVCGAFAAIWSVVRTVLVLSASGRAKGRPVQCRK